MTTTTVNNWLNTFAASVTSGVSAAVTYLVGGKSNPVTLSPAEQAEVDKYLIEMEETVGLNNSTYGLEWGERTVFCDEPIPQRRTDGRPRTCSH